MDIPYLRDQITAEANNLVAEVNTWRDEMLTKIDEVEKSEILRLLNNMNSRLIALEFSLNTNVAED